MNKTKAMIFKSYIIGFIVSVSLLQAVLPLISMMIVPLLFSYVHNSKFKENMNFLIIYIVAQSIMSMASMFHFLLSLYENSLLIIFVILLNLMKRKIKDFRFVLFSYYYLSINILFSILVIGFMNLMNDHYQATISFTNPAESITKILIDLLFIVAYFIYTMFVVIVSNKLYFITKTIEERIKNISIYHNG